MRWPLDTVFITQHFGSNPKDYAKFGLKGHNGLDFRASTGTSVFAPHSGKVIEAGKDPRGYGDYLKIENSKEGSILGHLQKFLVKVGDTVSEGQEIAKSDNTGNSTGPHLHWGYYSIPRDRSNGYSGCVDQEKLIGATMTDDISIPKKKFEELVSKSTQYDDLVKAGITSTADVDALRRTVKEANDAAGTAQQEAKATRDDFSDFKSDVADKLNCQQDLPRILSAIDDLMKTSDQAVKNAQKDSESARVANETILKLKAEITVLETRLAAKEWANEPTMEEIVKALITKLKKLVGR